MRRSTNAMARQVDTAGEDIVLELGAGTGAVTRAIQEGGVKPRNLLIVERDPTLCRLLSKRFPEVRVLHGDATNLCELLAMHGIERVEAVASSLPLLVMPDRVQRSILRQSFRLMGKHGVFLQYTYGHRAPIDDVRLRQLGLVARFSGRVWRNLPPATIWNFSMA